MDPAQRRVALVICRQFQRGIITAEDACEKMLLCLEPSLAAEYIQLLPDEAREMLPAVLTAMPNSEEGWVNFQRRGQFDGNDWTSVKTILEWRTNTEAVRICVLGEASPPAASDFADRVRVLYRAKLDEFRRLRSDSEM